MSRLLIDESPLQVLPSLAKAVGLEEAIVLQQLHYLLNASTNVRDGRTWVYNTHQEWSQVHFPWASEQTVRRVFKSLRDTGLVRASSEYNDFGLDKTLWYTIDYDELSKLAIDSSISTNGPSESTNGARSLDSSISMDSINGPSKSTNAASKSTNGPSKMMPQCVEIDGPITTRLQQEKENVKATPSVAENDIETEPAKSAPYRVFQALCSVLGTNPGDVLPRYQSKQLGVARNLLSRFDEEEIVRCLAYVASQSWRTNGIDLFTVQAEIDKWRLNGSLATEPATTKPSKASQNAGGRGVLVF